MDRRSPPLLEGLQPAKRLTSTGWYQVIDSAFAMARTRFSALLHISSLLLVPTRGASRIILPSVVPPSHIPPIYPLPNKGQPQTNGWRLTTTARLTPTVQGAKSMAVSYIQGTRRYLFWLDLDADGDLND